MTDGIRTVVAALAAADVADAIRRMPGLRRAVTLAERNRPAAGDCPCPRCGRARESGSGERPSGG
ncbi:hypothetical protein [Pseudonocardia sp.]|uniref:hypothetical protein n=1 Tax=Pseudonocardia sp. TaxID=60912 RepID=UPI003D14D551